MDALSACPPPFPCNRGVLPSVFPTLLRSSQQVGVLLFCSCFVSLNVCSLHFSFLEMVVLAVRHHVPITRASPKGSTNFLFSFPRVYSVPQYPFRPKWQNRCRSLFNSALGVSPRVHRPGHGNRRHSIETRTVFLSPF